MRPTSASARARRAATTTACSCSTTPRASPSALGPAEAPFEVPAFLHFGVGLPGRREVLELRDRLARDGVPIVGEWDEPDYVSVKCRDPDGWVIEASWEPEDDDEAT